MCYSLILSIGKQLEIPQNNSTTLTLSLLVAKKEGATDISRVLGDGPGVNFALVSSVNHNGCLLHTVSVRLEKARQKEMWEWLLERERGQLLARGLMAVILQSGTFLWMRGKPTSCKLPTCTYKKNNRNCHYRSPPPALFVQFPACISFP